MCLLVVAWHVEPGFPLVVGANRDEILDRPATAMTVLVEGPPRILGGRDEQAGGTWLAVNEHGLVVGLTNQPSVDGRDPTKRSRGELPLRLARSETASEAVAEFADVATADYNPAWLLVGDRHDLYLLDMTAGPAPSARPLPAGVHVLENRPLGAPSAKVARVRAELAAATAAGVPLTLALPGVLADHAVPDPAAYGVDEPGPRRIPEAAAACVHADGYGTRSSTLVQVPAAPGSGPPSGWPTGRPAGRRSSTSPASGRPEPTRPSAGRDRPAHRGGDLLAGGAEGVAAGVPAGNPLLAAQRPHRGGVRRSPRPRSGRRR